MTTDLLLTHLLKAVAYLARNTANSIKCGEAGGCEQVVSAMRIHGTSNAAVAEQGCWAIRNLTANNAANKLRLVAADARTVVASCVGNGQKAEALKRLA